MFSKKVHTDVKKSAQKVIDLKKDVVTRYKHLRNVVEHVEEKDLKTFFESNYSTIYHIFYENFILVETTLKQRDIDIASRNCLELPFAIVHKAHREELEAITLILDKILTLCPELICNRWQCYSLTYIITKLLHPGNSWKLRREAIKYFILWYQALGEDAPEHVHAIYSTIVPGFRSPFEDHPGLPGLIRPPFTGSVFHGSPIGPAEISVMYPPPSAEKQPEDEMRYFLDALLEFMVTQVPRIRWNDTWPDRHHRCFIFLFETFKKYYLPFIFPEYSKLTNIYKPVLELPELRSSLKTDKFLSCRVCLIKWVANFTHDVKQKEIPFLPQNLQNFPQNPSLVPAGSTESGSMDSSSNQGRNVLSFIQDDNSSPSNSLLNTEDVLSMSYHIVRDVLYGCRENINFIHEVYRQAFLLDFNYSPAIRRTIAVYKDWIQLNVTEIPPFMLEPLESEDCSNSETGINTRDTTTSYVKPLRLRNDSYVGAILKENILVRAGLQNLLQLFITHAANVFLCEIIDENPVLLEEQVDTCKRVLNMYRYMVMHTNMETKTWEQLLIILLKITSSILPKTPPTKRDETLGGRLAPAVFQTLIVTWIKANLNIIVTNELWDQFLDVLHSLTQWEELIREWAKTMETLTRVLARHVYKLDLLDLPLNRLTEQKAKRRRAMTSVTRKRAEFAENNYDHVQSSIVTEICDSEISHEEAEKHEIKWSAIRMKRSLSDTNIAYIRKCSFIKQQQYLTDTESEMDTNTNRRISRKEVVSLRRKWRSVDSLKKYTRDEDEFQQQSRCGSPCPSSGIEYNSVKDAPIQIDVISVEQPSYDTSTDDDKLSVMAGGVVRGWLPDVAVILWKRMLNAMGNVNDISDQNLHAQVFLYLTELANTLIKMYLNQGIPEDNQTTTEMPELIPPITYIAPWCFQALDLPSTYQRGKLYAYKLLCQTTLSAPNCVLTPIYVNMFLKILRDGLTSTDKNVVYTIVKYTGPRFFSRQLPGYTTLIPEYIQATSVVLTSDDLGLTPRVESVGILASLLSLTDAVSDFPLFQKTEFFTNSLKNRILKLLIHCAKKEQSGLARGIALSSLGIFLLQETLSENKHPLFKEAFNMLLLALKFNHVMIAQIACDVLLLFCEHVATIIKMYPELPLRTIEVIANTLGTMIPIEDRKKRLLTSLIFLLAEWTVKIPVDVLKQKRSSNFSLISSVFKVLDELANGSGTKPINVGGHFNPELVKEFVKNITIDNLKYDPADNSLFDNPSIHLNNTKHSLQIAAKMITAHIMENLGQFPLSAGAATLSSLVTEQDDIPGLSVPASDQLNSDVFLQPNIQVFVTTNNMIISFIELPSLENPGFEVPEGYIATPSCARVILRTLNGKYCWDATSLLPDIENENVDDCEVYLPDYLKPEVNSEEPAFSSYVPSDPPQTMRHRPPDILPTIENSAPDLDNLDDLLQYISHTSPEVLENPERQLNTPSYKSSITVDSEQQMISAILNQKFHEQEYLRQNAHILAPKPAQRRKRKDCTSDSSFSHFRLCRLFMSQFGFFSWEFREYIYLLQKNEKLLRELRNLDSQPCRETHKIAIIYVANGQEDKISILSNTGGSQNYENFIAALAWEVELETHTGFMGGLQRNKSTGVTAPYYATSLLEVIFHVSTRMPSANQEASINKTRHLGNDEVHIVWSEHFRDYRRDIIPTDFCDLLIVIYPLPLGLFRLQISRKSEVPFFGPFFNELVVEWRILPALVRTIAINASRAKRSMLPFYQQYYEERNRLLEMIIRNYKLNTTYEEFVAQCFSPTNTSISDKYAKSTGLRNMGVSIDSSFQSSHQGPLTSSLAFALIDTPHNIETDSCHSWPTSSAGSTDSPTGISPRQFKKPSKGYSRRSMVPSLTPPDSPTNRRFK